MIRIGTASIATAALVVVIFALENPLTVFANAAASLIGVSGAQSVFIAGKPAPEPVLAPRLSDAGQPAPAIRSAADVNSPPAARRAPSREEIATAFRVAHQGQGEIAPPPAAPAPPRRLDAREIAALLKRARSLIAIGDIAPARLLLERAAEAQEAGAALLLAQTYDPAVLGALDLRSITPDPATARGWYQKASQFGSRDAQQRLAQMQN